MIKYLYTFEDILKANGYTQERGAAKPLNEIVEDLELNITFTSFNISADSVIIELWKKLWAKYYTSGLNISYYDLSNDIAANVDIMADLVYRFLMKVEEDYLVKSTIIKVYNDNLNKLMDSIKSSSKSISRFNDTPQQGGAYEEDSYTSSITQGEVINTTDLTSVAARIGEIQATIRSIYKEWLDDLGVLFIEDYNYR